MPGEEATDAAQSGYLKTDVLSVELSTPVHPRPLFLPNFVLFPGLVLYLRTDPFPCRSDLSQPHPGTRPSSASF